MFKDHDITISCPKRSAIGKFKGSLSSLSVDNISQHVIKDILNDSQLDINNVSQVILGNVLSYGNGMNVAKKSAVQAGLPESIVAFNINHVCGSGLQSIIQAYHTIRENNDYIILAGGHESMSKAVHSMDLRGSTHLGDAVFTDTLINDGLTCSIKHMHMGLTAEHLARKYNISREEQDEYATRSHNRAMNAQKNHRFNNEIVPIPVKQNKKETVFSLDEHIRDEESLQKLKSLKPAFSADGTVTAGNASGINDAAACMIISEYKQAKENNLEVFGKIKAISCVGSDPLEMGIAPIKAVQEVLKKANWTIDELDVIESNEAFAVSSIIINNELKWDISKVNVNGGSIALGHPIGASGARIMVTLLHEMHKRDAKKGLCTVCIGGGMAIAICIEK